MSEEPRHNENALFLAQMYLAMDKPQQALDALQHPSTDQVEDPDFWLLRGSAYHSLERTQQALDAAKRGLAFAPEHARLLMLLSICESERDDLAAAERAILAALHQQPENPTLLCRYAMLLAEGNQLDKAERLLERARRYAPEHPHVRHTATTLAYLRGDDRRAKRLSRETLQDNPEDISSLHALGTLLLNEGSIGAADRHLKAAARLDPGKPIVIKSARASRNYAHWLLLPLRPAYRLGTVKMWLICVGTIFALGTLGFTKLASTLTVVYLAYCAYSWIVPPLIKWWYKRKYGGFR